MSSKSSSQALQQFVDKVKASEIVQRQDELKRIICGPLAVAKQKLQLLQSDEASTVLARIDPEYCQDIQGNVEGIFYEEVERGSHILEEIDVSLNELQALLDTFGQRIGSEKEKSAYSVAAHYLYEDARHVLVYLKLRTNHLRLQLHAPLETEIVKQSCPGFDYGIEDGDFMFHLNKLETSCLSGIIP